MEFMQLLTPALCFAKIQGRSQKRIFETLAKEIADTHKDLSYADIFDALSAREKLGSTGLGEGVAIPHCRIDYEGSSIAAVVSLAEGIGFDAPDQKPVDLLVFLLVAGEANQEHLNTLATLAKALSEESNRHALRDAKTNDKLFSTLASCIS